MAGEVPLLSPIMAASTSLRLVCIFAFTIFSSQQESESHIDHSHEIEVQKVNSSLTKHDVSKAYSQKLLERFGDENGLKVKDFEKMLNGILQQPEKGELSHHSESVLPCVDGLRILNAIESEVDDDGRKFTESSIIDRDHLTSACPMILFHISNQSLMNAVTCLQTNSTTKEVESRASVWFFSTIALIGISLCGLFGVIVIPIVDKNYYFYVLQYFMALAVGTLTGDALLHLLPHAMHPTSDGMNSHELLEMMMLKGVAAVLGIISFCFVERVLTMITKWKSKSPIKASPEVKPEVERLNNHSHKHGHSHGHAHTDSETLSSIVWMVILGDGLHNFTDGMAIGAAFSNNIAGGFSTTVAVFCHELPHELGDFAVLLKAGMSARKAIYYNILSSVLSFFGMCVGILIGETPEASQWIFATAAGLFIYIALVDMVNSWQPICLRMLKT